MNKLRCTFVLIFFVVDQWKDKGCGYRCHLWRLHVGRFKKIQVC